MSDSNNEDLPSSDETPLHLAAKQGNAAVVAQLLQHGAAVDARDRNGDTALRLAAGGNHAAVIRLLTEAGADLEVRPRFDDWTPLQHALALRHEDAVRELVRAGANVNADPSRSPHLWFELKSQDDGPLLDFAEGTRPLYLAVCWQHADIVNLLLDHGAEINALSFGWSALHAAVAIPSREMVELLLRRGADPQVRSGVNSPLGENYNQRTPKEFLAGFRRCGDLLRNSQ